MSIIKLWQDRKKSAAQAQLKIIHPNHFNKCYNLLCLSAAALILKTMNIKVPNVAYKSRSKKQLEMLPNLMLENDEPGGFWTLIFIL